MRCAERRVGQLAITRHRDAERAISHVLSELSHFITFRA